MMCYFSLRMRSSSWKLEQCSRSASSNRALPRLSNTYPPRSLLHVRTYKSEDKTLGRSRGHLRTNYDQLTHGSCLLRGPANQLSSCPTRDWGKELGSKRSTGLSCSTIGTLPSLPSLLGSRRGCLLRDRLRGSLAPDRLRNQEPIIQSHGTFLNHPYSQWRSQGFSLGGARSKDNNNKIT